MSKYKKWSRNEREFIAQNIGMKDQQIADRISELTGEKVSSDMIRQQRRRMRLIKSRGRHKETG